MTWEIRRAERRDAREIMVIERERFPEPWSLGMLLDEMGNAATRRYTVAIEAGRLLGYLGVMYVIDELHVNTLGVRADAEGRGVATALLDEAFGVARERGIARATLEVAVSNERAQRLYYRHGFRPVGVRKNYYEKTHEDALVLWNDDLAERAAGGPTLAE